MTIKVTQTQIDYCSSRNYYVHNWINPVAQALEESIDRFAVVTRTNIHLSSTSLAYPSMVIPLPEKLKTWQDMYYRKLTVRPEEFEV